MAFFPRVFLTIYRVKSPTPVFYLIIKGSLVLFDLNDKPDAFFFGDFKVFFENALRQPLQRNPSNLSLTETHEMQVSHFLFRQHTNELR